MTVDQVPASAICQVMAEQTYSNNAMHRMYTPQYTFSATPEDCAIYDAQRFSLSQPSQYQFTEDIQQLVFKPVSDRPNVDVQLNPLNRSNQLESLSAPRPKNDVIEGSYVIDPNTLLTLEINNNASEEYVNTAFMIHNAMTNGGAISNAAVADAMIHHQSVSISPVNSSTYSPSPTLTEKSLASKPSTASSSEPQSPLTFIKFEEPEFMEKNEPELEDESLSWVNPKQYRRILKRRIARQKFDAKYGISRERKSYIHKSRHLHALRRPRGPDGRFLTKAEIEEMSLSNFIAPFSNLSPTFFAPYMCSPEQCFSEQALRNTMLGNSMIANTAEYFQTSEGRCNIVPQTVGCGIDGIGGGLVRWL